MLNSALIKVKLVLIIDQPHDPDGFKTQKFIS